MPAGSRNSRILCRTGEEKKRGRPHSMDTTLEAFGWCFGCPGDGRDAARGVRREKQLPARPASRSQPRRRPLSSLSTSFYPSSPCSSAAFSSLDGYLQPCKTEHAVALLPLLVSSQNKGLDDHPPVRPRPHSSNPRPATRPSLRELEA